MSNTCPRQLELDPQLKLLSLCQQRMNHFHIFTAITNINVSLYIEREDRRQIPPPQFGKYFSSKYYVKFGHFAIFFVRIFLDKTVLPPHTVDWAHAQCSDCYKSSRGVARIVLGDISFFFWGGGIKLLNSRSDVIFIP